MKALRKIAALFGILLTITSPLFISSAAFADTSTYNQQVAAAQQKINDLQGKLTSAQQTLSDLQANSDGQAQLINAAQSAVTKAKNALDAASADYQSKSTAYDTAYADEQVAEQAVNDAITAVNTAADNVDNTYNVYVTAQSNTDAAQAAMTAAQSAYDKSSVTVGTKATPGLVADVYNNIDTNVSGGGTTVQRSTTAYKFCKTTVVSNIDADWGGGSVLGCNSDYVMIHYHGYITYNSTTRVYFQNLADDGFWMSINGQTIINDWSLKGCSANSTGSFAFKSGVSYAIDAWFYEWGGGACSSLYYQPSGGQWGVVPASMFTQQAVPTTTKDPALKTVLDQKTAAYLSAVAAEEAALQTYNNASDAYDASTAVYNQSLDILGSKQTVLSNKNDLLVTAENTWQAASDDKAVKDAALLTLKNKYKALFDSITAQGQLVDSLTAQLSQAQADLAAIPKPTSPTKVVKKTVVKPAPPVKVVPRTKFTPNPKS